MLTEVLGFFFEGLKYKLIGRSFYISGDGRVFGLGCRFDMIKFVFFGCFIVKWFLDYLLLLVGVGEVI